MHFNTTAYRRITGRRLYRNLKNLPRRYTGLQRRRHLNRITHRRRRLRLRLRLRRLRLAILLFLRFLRLRRLRLFLNLPRLPLYRRRRRLGLIILHLLPERHSTFPPLINNLRFLRL